ncbi:ABC transporter ATP-binding protein [Staphylococcus caprae]|uniref:ABC transporter ATP-binding protein n=1 Tax=Staphylococcus caprae TaxID=29380 RepID=UPI003B21C431
MLRISNIKKKFNKNETVLKDVNLSFSPSTIHCIIGKNGAGKTTLFNLISSILLPDSGEITINGKSLKKNTYLRKSIYFVSSDPFFYENLNCKNNILLISSLYGKEVSKQNILSALSKVGLDKTDLDKKVSNFSSGMKQKLNFACMLIVGSPIVLLDEPFNAIDQVTQRNFSNIIKELSNSGSTIIFTSHIVNTIINLAEDIHVLSEGYIVDERKCMDFPSEETLVEWITEVI